MLDHTLQALQAKDVNVFIDQFSFPYVLETLHGRNIVAGRAQMEEIFWRNVDYYDSIGMTDLVRRTVSAEFDGPDMIKAVYETTVFQAGTVAHRNRYMVYVEMQKSAERWRVTTSQYAISDSLAHSLALLGTSQTSAALERAAAK